jgi:hypothetical protein
VKAIHHGTKQTDTRRLTEVGRLERLVRKLRTAG